MVSDVKVQVTQRCGFEFLHKEKMTPTGIHLHLLTIYGDQTMDVSTVRQGGVYHQWCWQQWTTCTGADFYKHGMQAIVFCS